MTLVIGAKNTGKSMFCRGLLNALLNGNRRVALLDLDVGQGEFTIEGVFSLTQLTEPQLRTSSVPHVEATAQQWGHFALVTDRRVFFGDRSPEQNPLQYIEAIHFLLQQYFTTWSGRSFYRP